ncbi:MAG TPA: SDR family NAD(P)-dependent oxidoreductase [Solirubrobacteraceae bacterium]|nr:SDR family NAD(P)-dependent oxidoreductase [Solirubrobacteraceae bacterium]
MSAVRGKVAAVTGAGSGIGRAIALELAARGARGLALSDVNEAGLEETRKAVASRGGAEVELTKLDVSDREAVEAYAAATAERFGAVHQIYNNAGIAFSRTILESEYADYERVFGVNLWGVIHGTKAFLPHVIASGDGHVINISSLNGFFAQGEMSHYVSTKFAVRGFTETLRIEMLQAGHRVGVTVVHPGGIKTNIANSALESAKALGLPTTEKDERRRQTYNEKLLKMPADQAAKIIVDGVEKDRPRVLVGNDAKAVDKLVRLASSSYPKLSVFFDKRMK